MIRRIDQTRKANGVPELPVNEWLDTWLEDYAKLSIRPSSHKTYKGFIENHIKPAVGNIPLEELISMDLQKLYKHLLESGWVDRIEARIKPKSLSVKTVRNSLILIISYQGPFCAVRTIRGGSEAQVDYYTRYIQRNPEWKFISVYTDEGISGLNTKKREGFNRMVADALAGRLATSARLYLSCMRAMRL